MPFIIGGAIKYYKFPCLENQGLTHAVFTRHGGFSPTPWHSLNFGASVGDNLQRVAINRATALSTVNMKPESVFDVYQVHSNLVVTTNRALMLNEQHQKADAILTNRPEVSLMMRFADCVPILLFDPVKRVIGIAHAGWVGTADRIARNTVLRMVEVYGSNPGDIIAAIGPSIGPDHYSVGKDVLNRISSGIGAKSDQCIVSNNGQTYLNLWKANEIILNEVGVTKVEIAGICTYSNIKDWYSHRGEHGKTGRFGVVFTLQQ